MDLTLCHVLKKGPGEGEGEELMDATIGIMDGWDLVCMGKHKKVIMIKLKCPSPVIDNEIKTMTPVMTLYVTL